ncbi:pheromone-binding protein Gp-9-like [Temnothorax longispinosus]|uniref:pheromone-binding protein Gp-9-like n=1 Tax=Temnothorax longispinosus TaxID=300112 RepID=UPI003A99BA5A
MEKPIFYICTFALISFTVGAKLGSSTEHYNICLTENNVSDDDMFTIKGVIFDIYNIFLNESEKQENIKKNGCVLQCILEKFGIMEGSEYDVEKMRSETIPENIDESTKLNMLKGLNNCINETKDLTEKCEKSFNLVACGLKSKFLVYFDLIFQGVNITQIADTRFISVL